MEQKKFFDEISMMRLMAILIIVFFHSYQMMYGYSHFPNSYMIYEKMYYSFNQSVIIHIGMPVFVFISGFLHTFSYKKKQPTFTQVLKNKLKRIVFPYFVFAFLLTVGTPGFDIVRLLSGGYTHLWFLPMIFWCFLIGYLLVKYLKFEKYAVPYTIAFLALLLFPEAMYVPVLKDIQSFCLLGTYSWFGWFALGMTVYLKSDKLIALFSAKKYLLLVLLAVYVACMSLFPLVPYGKTLAWYTILGSLCIILVIWYVFRQINWRELKIFKYLLVLSNHSFGIYIFHMPVVIYAVSSTSQRLFGLTYLADHYFIAFPFAYASGCFILSFMITFFVQKLKVGKYLLG